MSPSPAPLNLHDFLATITRGPGNCLCSLAHRGRNGGSGGLEAWIQLLGMLLLLLGIFAAAAWAIKRWRLLPQLREGGQNLKVVESRSLGQRNSILVVQYMDRKFLVGSGSNGVQLIGDLGGDSPSIGQAVPSDPAVSVDEGVESEKRPGFLSSLSQHIQKEGK